MSTISEHNKALTASGLQFSGRDQVLMNNINNKAELNQYHIKIYSVGLGSVRGVMNYAWKDRRRRDLSWILKI